MSNIGLVQNISCVEDTLSTLLVYTNLNTEVKLQTDLKTKYSMKIGNATVPQCLHKSRHCMSTPNLSVSLISLDSKQCSFMPCIFKSTPEVKVLQNHDNTFPTYLTQVPVTDLRRGHGLGHHAFGVPRNSFL